MLQLPFNLAGCRIDSTDGSPKRLGVVVREICAAVEGVTGFVGLWRGAENVTLLARGDVKKLRLRVVSGRKPVGRSKRSGTNGHSCQCRRGFFALDRNAARVFRIAPGHTPVGSRGKKFSIGAINHVKKAVTVCLQDEMAVAVIHKHGNLRCIVIVLVVLGELEMPFQLAVVWIERQQRIAVKIVTRSALATVRWRRIPGSPESRIGRGIVCASDPRWRAADFPGVAFPGFVAWLIRPGNRVETPFARAGRSIISINEPANAVFAAGNANEHEILDD